jgi:hypothetical protein
MKEKYNAYFYLIEPSKSLRLIATNDGQLFADENTIISDFGILSFKARNRLENTFTILVRRKE